MPPTPDPATLPVLLVDDQAIVGAAVRRMLDGEPGLVLHHCTDPAQAIETANRVGPMVILQDLVMPEIDGLTLVKFFRANPATRDVPLVVLSTKEEPTTKAEAFARGANDYLVKLPDKLELVARLRYHARAYLNLLERNAAYGRLADEIAQAARYVQSLLPAPLADGGVRTAWRHVPSTTLGGDSFGYGWLDGDTFAVYLLDVCGHGVGSALLSVSAMNVLGARTLPGVDFRDPAAVLAGLNDMFPMEKHDGKYFTIWYGVYTKSARRLRYCGGAHPAALLFGGGGGPEQMRSEGYCIGMLPGYEAEARELAVPPGGRLVLYSDGVYEVERPDGTMMDFAEFVTYLGGLPADEPDWSGRVLAHARRQRGHDGLADDFSMLDVVFE